MTTPAPAPIPAAPPPSRRLRILQRALVAVFAGLLALPLANNLTGEPRDKQLAGVEVAKPLPRLTWTSWFDASFARAVERELNRHIGLRGYLVRMANQANYSLFGRLPVSGTPVDEGRDHWLFEHVYVQHYLRRPHFSDERRDAFAAQLRDLHRELERRGMTLAVVVATSKPEIYPEQLPANLPPRHGESRTAHDQLVPALKEAGVPVLDVRALFLALKPEHPMLFPSGGTHWSHYGAQRATDELLRLLRDRPGWSDLPAAVQAEVVWKTPQGTDRDLRDLLNLWRYEPGGPARLPYPVMQPAAAPSRAAVVIGDSFSFTLIDALARAGTFARMDLLYYFKRRYAFDRPVLEAGKQWTLNHAAFDQGPFDPGQGPGWGELLARKPAIILEMNEVHLYSTGWGSVESLLAFLRDSAAE